MNSLRLGVTIGNNAASYDAFAEGVGQKIARLWLDEDAGRLRFEFENGYRMSIADETDVCYECHSVSRYMTTDDDLSAFVGATLENAETRNGNNPDALHEVRLIVVTTSAGQFVCTAHKEYLVTEGDFKIRAQKDKR